ncbi:olfactory receptor 52K1-like [Chanos chanos]|uniref:Olfactory receptor 52K1-like n=1 Tax=Chanos chanos TaxID=29144 RepID=A0A6J2VP04_CHACN|nr:olfactory receptor 52K1-like [Chanos chanos]
MGISAITHRNALKIDDNQNNTSHIVFILNGFYSLGEWRPLLSVPFLLMFLMSLLSNSILLYLIISKRTLHSPMIILIGLMAVVDLCLPIVIVPKMLLGFLFNWDGISLAGCLAQMFCIHFVGSFQSTLLVWMALDRYFAICRPLYYHKYMDISNFLKFVIIPVIRNALLIITMICRAGALTFCRRNVMDHCFCEHMALVQLACGDISVNNLIGLVSAFLIPTADFVFITASYIFIFASVFKTGRSNFKAVNTCITHIIVMTVTLTFALIAFMSYRIKNNFSSNSRHFVSTMYLLFPSFLNPVIYGVRTKEIRQQLLMFMKCLKISPVS